MARRVDLSKKAQKIIDRVEGLGLIRAMNRTVVNVRDFLKRQYMGASNTGPKRLARNTGAMERHTISTRAEKTPNDSVSATIQVNVPYASIHFSDGGQKFTRITPKHAQKLTVPILKNAQRRAPHPASYYKSRFAYNNILYAVRDSKFVFPIFALRRSVTVPSRIDIKNDIQPYARRVLAHEIQKELAVFNK